MTSAPILYTFELTVNDTDQAVFDQARVQCSAHPEEPLAYTISRALAFAHCLRWNPQLGEGWYDLRQPAIFSTDVVGDYILWAAVGDVPKRAIKNVQHLKAVPHVRFYFYQKEQQTNFSHLLRGSRENWIQGYEFFQLDERLITLLAEVGLPRRSQWSLNLVESTLYLEIEGETHESQIEPLDMWSIYQQTLTAADDAAA